MKELDLIMFVAVFQEMLGALLWPLVFVSLFGIFAFITLLIYDKRIIYRRLVTSSLLGLLGGIVALYIVVTLSVSSFTDSAGPIDWILVTSIYLGGVFATAIGIYTLWGWGTVFRQTAR